MFSNLMASCILQGAKSLARSLRVVNEALVSLDLGFNEIRVRPTFPTLVFVLIVIYLRNNFLRHFDLVLLTG